MLWSLGYSHARSNRGAIPASHRVSFRWWASCWLLAVAVFVAPNAWPGERVTLSQLQVQIDVLQAELTTLGGVDESLQLQVDALQTTIDQLGLTDVSLQAQLDQMTLRVESLEAQLDAGFCGDGEALRNIGGIFSCCPTGQGWSGTQCLAKCDIDAPGGFSNCAVFDPVDNASFNTGTIVIQNVDFFAPVRNTEFGFAGNRPTAMNIVLDNVRFRDTVADVQFWTTAGSGTGAPKHVTLTDVSFSGLATQIEIAHSCGAGSNDNRLTINNVAFPGVHFVVNCPFEVLPDGAGGACGNAIYTCP